MDPWAIPYFCYALLAMFTAFVWAQLRFNAERIKQTGDQIKITLNLLERLAKLEASDDQ